MVKVKSSGVTKRQSSSSQNSEESEESRKDNITSVKSWLLEYACKHSLMNLIHAISPSEESLEQGQNTQKVLSQLVVIDVTCMMEPNLDMLVGDPQWLSLLIAVCDKLAQGKVCGVTSCPSAFKLGNTLKLLELLHKMQSGTFPDIIKLLYRYFPPYDYEHKEHNTANEMRQSVQRAREFVQKLLMNQTRRRSYYAGHYARDVARLEMQVRDNLDELRSHLKGLKCIEYTALERVILGARDDLQHNPSPVFKALLEHIPSTDVSTPQSLEASLVCLVRLFDGGASQLLCPEHCDDGKSAEIPEDVNSSSTSESPEPLTPSKIRKKLKFDDIEQPRPKRKRVC